MDDIKIYFQSWWKSVGPEIGRDRETFCNKDIAFEAFKVGIDYGISRAKFFDGYRPADLGVGGNMEEKQITYQ